MAELADAADLKSADGDILRVQVPLAPLFRGKVNANSETLQEIYLHIIIYPK
jgi:hypothetical protein